jgi:aryl-alcohol dehydrogenase-like predicted oxidoreductase
MTPDVVVPNLVPHYRRLGHSGLRVAPIALGTMQFGWSADEARSFEIMDAYFAAGGNFIDTADIYSAWVPNNPGGVSEEIIGRWMQARGNRDQIVLATKARGAMGQNFSQGRKTIYQREGLSRRWLLQACEDSLKRLGVEYIDLYQVHSVDTETPIEETLSALTDLVRKGYVRYIGCSNFPAWRMMESLWVAEKHGFERFVSMQPEYSLVDPIRANFERELQKVAVQYGVGVIPYSPLAGGFLTGKYRKGQPLPDSVRAGSIEHGRFSDHNFEIVEKLLEIAARHNSSAAQVALAWTLAQPAITSPIIGANSVAQLHDLLATLDLKLSAAELAEVSQVSSWVSSRTDRED